MSYDTYGLMRGQNGTPLQVSAGTLDLATVQSEATAITTTSGSIATSLTLGATVGAGDVTNINSLVAEAAALVTAAGTVTSDMFAAINTSSGADQLDLRVALGLIEQYLLGAIVYGNTNTFPTPD